MRIGSRGFTVRNGIRALSAAMLVGAALTGPTLAEPLAPSVPRACQAYGKPTAVGEVPGPLEELSGMAASRTHDGIYWAHNDSGNAFELFAIDQRGSIRARFPLLGEQSRDIEDIAVGPCAKGAATSCIYLGDIGDNRYRRPDGRIYRLAEPETLAPRSLPVEVFRFRWPDGAQNAEAMVVDPKSARIFVWTKEPQSLGLVHRLDALSTSGVGRAVPVKRIQADDPRAGLPTGADAHQSGDRLLIRTYNQAWELRRDGAESFEDLLRAEPLEVPARTQRQSEAIAYTHDGRGYLLGTEGAGGPIYAVGCADTALGSSRSSS